MNMQFNHRWLKLAAFSVSIITSVSCGAQQSTPSSAVDKKPAPIPVAQAKCPAVAELFRVLGQKKIYEQTAESFFQSVAAQLKFTKDETKDLSVSEKMRTLTLASSAGEWVETGESVYTLVKDGERFNSLTLEVSKSCFSAPKEFIALGQSVIGNDGKKIIMPPPDAAEMMMWRWKDPDINMIRTLELAASNDSYTITVKRDPDSEGVAE